MRNLKELYTILLESYKKTTAANRAVIEHGGYLCNVIMCLEENGEITSDEYNMLYDHFKTQRPTKEVNSDFYNSTLYDKGERSVWFKWHDCSKEYIDGVNDDALGINIRIALLESIISKL